jgi:PPIC-type PPIASE domain
MRDFYLAHRRPVQFGGGLLTLAVLLLAGWLGWSAHRHHQDPVRIGSVEVPRQAYVDAFASATAQQFGKAMTVEQCQADKACKPMYARLLKRSARTMTEQSWLIAEAKEQGITATKAEIDAAVKGLGLDKEAGFSVATQRRIAEAQVVSGKIEAKQPKKKDPTDAQKRAYYEKNIKLFQVPEKRDIYAVHFKSKSDAEAIAAGIRARRSIAKLMEERSDDPRQVATGGVQINVTKASLESDIQRVFNLPDVGDVSEPYEASGKWWVVGVTRIVPAVDRSYANAKDEIKQRILEPDAIRAYATERTKRLRYWRAKTVCYKPFITDYCKNGPPLSDRWVLTSEGKSPAIIAKEDESS